MRRNWQPCACTYILICVLHEKFICGNRVDRHYVEFVYLPVHLSVIGKALKLKALDQHHGEIIVAICLSLEMKAYLIPWPQNRSSHPKQSRQCNGNRFGSFWSTYFVFTESPKWSICTENTPFVVCHFKRISFAAFHFFVKKG